MVGGLIGIVYTGGLVAAVLRAEPTLEQSGRPPPTVFGFSISRPPTPASGPTTELVTTTSVVTVSVPAGVRSPCPAPAMPELARDGTGPIVDPAHPMVMQIQNHHTEPIVVAFRGERLSVAPGGLETLTVAPTGTREDLTAAPADQPADAFRYGIQTFSGSAQVAALSSPSGRCASGRVPPVFLVFEGGTSP
jgi:hypothetical protein